MVQDAGIQLEVIRGGIGRGSQFQLLNIPREIDAGSADSTLAIQINVQFSSLEGDDEIGEGILGDGEVFPVAHISAAIGGPFSGAGSVSGVLLKIHGLPASGSEGQQPFPKSGGLGLAGREILDGNGKAESVLCIQAQAVVGGSQRELAAVRAAVVAFSFIAVRIIDPAAAAERGGSCRFSRQIIVVQGRQAAVELVEIVIIFKSCLLYTSPSPRDA